MPVCRLKVKVLVSSGWEACCPGWTTSLSTALGTEALKTGLTVWILESLTVTKGPS